MLEDLTKEILGCLSAEELFAVRPVCKEWSALLRDDDFKRRWAAKQNSGDNLFILRLRDGRYSFWKKEQPPSKVRCYSWGKNRFQSIPFSWLAPDGSYPCAAGDGLICCWYPQPLWSKDRGFIVGNPITRKWVRIPGAPYPFFCFLRTYRDTESNRVFFRIICDTLIFDSKLGFWKRPKCMETNSILTGVVTSYGDYFVITGDHCLVQIDLDNVELSRQLCEWPELPVVCAAIGQHMLGINGCLGLIGSCRVSNKLSVFILDTQNWIWKLYSTPPEYIQEMVTEHEQKSCRIEVHTFHSLTFFALEMYAGCLLFDSISMLWYWLRDDVIDDTPAPAGVLGGNQLISLELDLQAAPDMNMNEDYNEDWELYPRLHKGEEQDEEMYE